jgi:hypothetical protein
MREVVIERQQGSDSNEEEERIVEEANSAGQAFRSHMGKEAARFRG